MQSVLPVLVFGIVLLVVPLVTAVWYVHRGIKKGQPAAERSEGLILAMALAAAGLVAIFFSGYLGLAIYFGWPHL